jgi:hypothetical protein
MAWVNVLPKPGVVRLATPNDAPNTFWSTDNVRWVAGALCPTGGSTKLTYQPTASFARKLFQWRDSSNEIWTAVGCEQNLYILYGSLSNVTPTAFKGFNDFNGGGYGIGFYDVGASPDAAFCVDDNPIGTTDPTKFGTDVYGRKTHENPAEFRKPDYWSMDTWGQNLVSMSSSDGRLLQVAPTFGVFPPATVMSNAPHGIGTIVTPERSCVILGAFNPQVSTDTVKPNNGLPYSDTNSGRFIAWSDFENIDTGWNYNQVTGQAGWLQLEATTPIVTGIEVKEGVLVLTQREAFIFSYVGAPYFYSYRPLGNTTFYTPNAIATAGGRTIWLGDETFWEYDGATIKPLQCPFFNDLKQDLDDLNSHFRCHMHANGKYPEFWLEYPSVNSTDGECDKYIIYNYAEGWWASGSRRRTASCGATTANFPIASGVDKLIYRQEDGWLEDGDKSRSAEGRIYVETAILDIGANNGIIDINQAIVACDPTFNNQNYALTFFSKFTPDQSDVQYGPYYPRADGYTDTRVTARDIRMKIQATDDEYWSVGQVRLNAVPTGSDR